MNNQKTIVGPKLGRSTGKYLAFLCYFLELFPVLLNQRLTDVQNILISRPSLCHLMLVVFLLDPTLSGSTFQFGSAFNTLFDATVCSPRAC